MSHDVERAACLLRVGAYGGHRYPERPEWVEIDGDRVEVVEVERTWREEDRLGFAVTLRDRRRVVMYYNENDDVWTGNLTA